MHAGLHLETARRMVRTRNPIDQRRRAYGAWFGIGVLLAISLSALLNRQMIVLVTESLKKSMGLSDTQIGSLNGMALLLVIAIATYPMGWLADRVDRRILLSICVAIWSASTVAFALASNFTMLFVFTMGIAVAEAVLGPIAYTIIPDLFPRDRWIFVNYVYFLGNNLVLSLSAIVAGTLIGVAEADRIPPIISAGLESWRVALILAALAAPVLIVLTLLIPLPKRAPPVASAVAPQGVLEFFRAHPRSLAGVFLGFGIVYAAHGTMNMWFAISLTRIFAVPPARVGVVLGLVFGAATFAGIGLSGLLVRLLRPRYGQFSAMIVAQLGVIGAMIVTPFLAIATTATQAFVVGGLKYLFMTACLSVSPTILQLLAPSHIRGRVIALGGMVSIFFMAAGPVVQGLVSDHFFPGPNQLNAAIVALTLPCFFVGILLLRFGSATLPGTMASSSGEPAGDLDKAAA